MSQRGNDDVRMRGFAHRASVEAAVAWIDSVLPDFKDLSAEEIPLMEAGGRVLAIDVTSRADVPGFDRSMMDGYALRADETHGATPYNPLSFRIIGTCLPGQAFPQTVQPGQAVRIMTGAPLPLGADAVLPAEQAAAQDQTLLATGDVSAGKHVGKAGEDVPAGSLVLKAGRILRPQDLGVLSSVGCSTVPAIREPRVRILITGQELLPAGTFPEDCQIADANSPMLQALVKRDGGLPHLSGIIPDIRDDLAEEMSQVADIVLVSGGSSVGQEDHAPRILAERGVLAIHGIAMRPSSPTGMGKLNGAIVFLLPGNPVSCLCAYDFFAGRAIRAMSGLPREWPYRRIVAKLRRKLVSAIGRVDYARVEIHDAEAEPLAIGGASVLTSTTRADGFVIIPADSEGYAQGSEVNVYLYDAFPGLRS